MSYTDYDFPHSRFFDDDLRELIRMYKEFGETLETFISANKIKFADPIIWNITTQYPIGTIVLDTTGNAYLSKQPVPAGIELNNDNYWQEIFNFTTYTRTANRNLTVNIETNTTRATAGYNTDDWLIWNDILYKVTRSIAIDDTFIVAPEAGYNIIHFTVEDFIKAFISNATNLINQYKDDIDASELQYINDVQAYVSDTTNSLQAQLNAAIAGATVDSEVINARVGADGITYATLGEAIRTQITHLIESDNAYICVREDQYITYNYDTKTITFPTGGFFFYSGRGIGNSSGDTIDLTNILYANACALVIDSSGIISGVSWVNHPYTLDQRLIGYIYNYTVIIFGVPQRNINVINNSGSVLFDRNTQGSYLGVSETRRVLYDKTNQQLTLPVGFYVYRGYSGARAASTIDLTQVATQNNAWKLWIKPDGTVYATTWFNTGVPTDLEDDCIGYIFENVVIINGIPYGSVEVLNGNESIIPTYYSPSALAIHHGANVVYNFTTKELTIPTGYSIYRGVGSPRTTAITLDLTDILVSYAANLYLKSDGTIYAAVWWGPHFSSADDVFIGYVYQRNVFICGIPEEHIIVTDDDDTSKVFCFGDSITAGVGASILYHMHFHDWLPSYHFYNWGVGSTGYVVQATGDVVAGQGVEGDGHTVTESGNNTILDVMSGISGNIDNIVIAAGTNDFSRSIDSTTFRTAVANTLDYALTKTAKILVITPLKRQNWEVANSANLYLQDYCNIIIEECENRGITYVIGYDININPSYADSRTAFMPDGLHPNDTCQTKMARCFYQKLLEALCI